MPLLHALENLKIFVFLASQTWTLGQRACRRPRAKSTARAKMRPRRPGCRRSPTRVWEKKPKWSSACRGANCRETVWPRVVSWGLCFCFFFFLLFFFLFSSFFFLASSHRPSQWRQGVCRISGGRCGRDAWGDGRAAQRGGQTAQKAGSEEKRVRTILAGFSFFLSEIQS